MTYLKRAEKRGGKFLNPAPTVLGGFRVLFKALPRFLMNKAELTPKIAVGPFQTDAAVYARPPASGLRVTWFGHSTSLVEIDGARVLIDPVWEPRASSSRWLGPKRFFAPTMALSDMPALDAILISHDHYDHLGADTIAMLAKLPAARNARWITSLGVGRWLRKFGVAEGRITELDWTESVRLPGLKVTAWPARHFSGRGLRDRFRTLWSSFVLEGNRHRVYYGADSGWWDGFVELGEQYAGFDLTMLEIGAFDPLWESIHLGPDNAVRAFEAIGGVARAGVLMPIHWGLFNLGLHAWRQPMERLELVAGAAGVPLWSPEPGVPTEVDGNFVSGWWRS